jgi:hypothetical protein
VKAVEVNCVEDSKGLQKKNIMHVNIIWTYDRLRRCAQKMIKNFVIEYAKMEVRSANIVAEKYENQAS